MEEASYQLKSYYPSKKTGKIDGTILYRDADSQIIMKNLKTTDFQFRYDNIYTNYTFCSNNEQFPA